MAAISLTRRQCGVFLLGAVLVVNVCQAGPAAAPESSVKKSQPKGTALAIVTTTAEPGRGSENTTAANKNETNATAASNATHVNGTQGGANTTVSSTASHTEATGDGGVNTEAPTYYFSNWITWKEDNYLMSVMIPVACGVGAAVLILCALACIGCCRRRCRSRRGRRNLPKKIDPKTFRKMKAADRIKLLAASSDEEF